MFRILFLLYIRGKMDTRTPYMALLLPHKFHLTSSATCWASSSWSKFPYSLWTSLPSSDIEASGTRRLEGRGFRSIHPYTHFSDCNIFYLIGILFFSLHKTTIISLLFIVNNAAVCQSRGARWMISLLFKDNNLRKKTLN